MIRFKTDRIESEFQQLMDKNFRLYEVAACLNLFMELEIKKEFVITEIFRTRAEFDALYAQTPPDKRPVTSPHLTWDAFDFRSTHLTDREKERIKSFLNQFTYKQGAKPVCLIHTVAGNVEHAHVQYV